MFVTLSGFGLTGRRYTDGVTQSNRLRRAHRRTARIDFLVLVIRLISRFIRIRKVFVFSFTANQEGICFFFGEHKLFSKYQD